MQRFLRWLPLYLIVVSTLGTASVVLLSALAIARPEMMVTPEKPLAAVSTEAPQPTLLPTVEPTPEPTQLPENTEAASLVATPTATTKPTPTKTPPFVTPVVQIIPTSSASQPQSVMVSLPPGLPQGNVNYVGRFVVVTPTPFPTAAALPYAQCLHIKLYRVTDSRWVPIRDISGISKGENIMLAVVGGSTQGIIDKARFRVNGTTNPWNETVNVNRYGEYYFEYQIPKNATALDIEAQIHHVSLGWY